jgi:hypothetical protein
MARSVKKEADFKGKALIVILCAIIMISAGLIARAVKPDAKEVEGTSEIGTVSPADHQAIKADVVNKDPSHYTIDVKKMANMNADDDADTFAVYLSSSVPKTCGDFRELKLPYEKPEKYKRVFDLSDHPEVVKALDHYGCVVMKNIPPSAS